MKIKEQFCNNEKCPHYGIAGKGNIYVTTTYRSGKRTRKVLRCRTCGARFSERHNTPLFYLHTRQDTVEKIVKALAEGNSIRATSRIMDVDKNTICRILDRVAIHCEKISAYLIKDLHLTEIQLDELWSFIKKEKNLTPLEKILFEYGDSWVWCAFNPANKMLVAIVVGPHTRENANLLIEKVDAVSDGDIPFFTSDELPHYKDALLKKYGHLEEVPREPGKRRRPRKIRLVPHPGLDYAQVVKSREKGRVVDINTTVIFGDPKRIAQRLVDSPVSNHINTAFVERNNLTLRQTSRRLTRKTNGFSKKKVRLEFQLHLAIAYYHFVKLHSGLKNEVNAHGKRWQERTPAMAAGITDHIWSMGELLEYLVPRVKVLQ